MTRKRKSVKEVEDVAETIASVVVAESVNSDESKKAEEVKVVVSTQQKQEKPKEQVKEVPVAKSAPIKNVRVKATASVRGQFRNLRYEIVAGELYTFPKPLADWLISQGRAI